jgi:lysophospholipase L1-like esterase
MGPAALVVMVLMMGACVPIRVPDPAVRYIAFGDSTTADDSGDGYAEQLRVLLGEPPEALANEGFSGETSEEGLARLERILISGLYPEAQQLLFWEGGNDVTEFISDFDPFLLFSPDDPEYPFTEELEAHLAATRSNIESAVLQARQAGLDVFVATMYFIREDVGMCEAMPFDVILPSQAFNANAYVRRLNERIREAAGGRGATVVDVAAQDEALRAQAEHYRNCNHLSGEGNAIVADVFYDAIVGLTD